MWIALLLALQEPEPKPIPTEPPQPGKTELRVETPTRTPMTSKESPFAVTSLSKEEIDLDRTDTTTELLRNLPGLHMVLQGSRGYITSTFMRGTDSAHTLVLLDGFKVNQDGDTFNHFDLLSPRGLGSIEVFRGPGSAIYGSSASGGVIQLSLEKGAGTPKGYASGAYGSFDTNMEHVQMVGQYDRVSFNVMGSRIEQLDGEFPNNEFENHNAAARVDIQLAQRATIKLITRYIDSHTDNYTNGAGDRLSPLEPDAFIDDEVVLIGVECVLGPTDYLDIVVRHGYYKKHQFSSDLATPGDGDFGPFLASSLFFRHTTDVSANVRMGQGNVFTAGIESQLERFDRESNFGDIVEHRDNTAAYVQDEIRMWKSLTVVVGVRVEQNDFYHNETTARGAASYFFRETGTKLRASAGNSITAPSFFDLFGFGGDPNLRPERTDTVDGGVDQWLLDDAVRVSATGFINWIEDLIVFSGGAVRNVGRVRTWGGEFELEVQIPYVEGLTVRCMYTLLETYDASTGKPLIRRPEHSGKFGVQYRTERVGISVDFGFVGPRPDSNFAGFPAVRETVPGFVKLDLAAFVRVWGDVRITARVENALDIEYQEVRGFTASGMSAMFGIEAGGSLPEGKN